MISASGAANAGVAWEDCPTDHTVDKWGDARVSQIPRNRRATSILSDETAVSNVFVNSESWGARASETLLSD